MHAFRLTNATGDGIRILLETSKTLPFRQRIPATDNTNTFSSWHAVT